MGSKERAATVVLLAVAALASLGLSHAANLNVIVKIPGLGGDAESPELQGASSYVREGISGAHAMLYVHGQARKSFIAQHGTGAGSFSFGGIPSGIHRVEVNVHGLQFPALRLEISEDGRSTTLRYSDVTQPPLQPKLEDERAVYEIRPMGMTQIYDQKQASQLGGILKNPYVLIFGGGAIFLWILTQIVDVEELQKEMESERRSQREGGAQ